MRSLLLFLALCSTMTALASPVDHIITVKDRLRLHLWHEGVTPVKKQMQRPQVLPDELERPLRKL